MVISLLKFASDIFYSDEDGMAWRLYDGLRDRRRLEYEVKKIIQNGGKLYFWSHNNGEREPQILALTDEADWLLVRDIPLEAGKPEQLDYFEYINGCNRTRDMVKKHLTEDEKLLISIGPGIIIENTFNGEEEYYPLDCLGIELGNNEERLSKRLKLEVEVPSGNLNNIKLNINKDNTLNLQANIKPDTHTSGGEEFFVGEVKIRAKIWKGTTTLLFIMFLTFLVGCNGAPGDEKAQEKPTENKDWEILYDRILESPVANNTPPVVVVSTSASEMSKEEKEKAFYAFEKILEKYWKNTTTTLNPQPATSTNTLNPQPSTSHSSAPITTQSVLPIKYIQPTFELLSDNGTFEQPEPFQQQPQQNSFGGPIRCRRPNTKCFVCNQQGHLTKSCPTLVELRSGTTMSASTSHNNNMYGPSAKALRKAAHELQEMATRWASNPSISQLLKQLAEFFLQMSTNMRN
uniref:CCHC-type domain-containing protein n=2 Tax=Meloidogyne TaxID=189290 RepID=A0A915NP12_9BILA